MLGLILELPAISEISSTGKIDKSKIAFPDNMFTVPRLIVRSENDTDLKKKKK